jgi:hypothetical protein
MTKSWLLRRLRARKRARDGSRWARPKPTRLAGKGTASRVVFALPLGRAPRLLHGTAFYFGCDMCWPLQSR